MKNIIIALTIIIALPGFCQQTVEGVTMPATINVKSQKLVLNGAGLREKLFLDLYVGALYLTEKNKDANTIIANDKAMAIKMEINLIPNTLTFNRFNLNVFVYFNFIILFND